MKITNEDLIPVLKTIGKTFKVLSKREIQILRLRHGLEDGVARTLEETGKEFNITRERVRQLEAKAIEKVELILEYEE